jgi:hypothetical protein
MWGVPVKLYAVMLTGDHDPADPLDQASLTIRAANPDNAELIGRRVANTLLASGYADLDVDEVYELGRTDA